MAYTWSVTAGALPAGLSLAGATGVISGTPTAAGTFPFTVQVADGAGATAVQALSIVVGASVGALTVTTVSLPSVAAGTGYDQFLAAAGGAAPYTWAVTAGAMPAAFTLNAATGEITGAPASAGTSSFTVTVTDSLSATASKALSVTVTAAASGKPIVSCDNGYSSDVWAAVAAKVPGVAGFRTDPGGAGSTSGPNYGMPVAWNTSLGTPPAAASTLILSWKPLVTGANGILSGTLDTQIASWARSCEAYAKAHGPKSLFVSLWHEGETNDKQLGSSAILTGPQIRSMHDRVYRIFKPLAPDVWYGEIFSAYLLGNAAATLGGPGTYQGYLCCPAMTSTLTGKACAQLDYVAFDGYGTNAPGSTKTPTAHAVYDNAFSATQALNPGVPVAIAENNTEVRSYKPSWFAQTWALAKANKCVFWSAWFAHGSPAGDGLDWDSSDTATIAELKAIVAE